MASSSVDTPPLDTGVRRFSSFRFPLRMIFVREKKIVLDCFPFYSADTLKSSIEIFRVTSGGERATETEIGMQYYSVIYAIHFPGFRQLFRVENRSNWQCQPYRGTFHLFHFPFFISFFFLSPCATLTFTAAVCNYSHSMEAP